MTTRNLNGKNVGMTKTANTFRAESPWLTKAEAAEYSKVHPDTIDRWRREGLVFSMVGGVVRIHVDDLDKFIRSHQARTIARRHRVTA